MLKTHKVKRKFNQYILLSEIPDENNDLKHKIHQSLNEVIQKGDAIQFDGTFGLVLDLNDDSTFEWSKELKTLLPLSLPARETHLGIICL